MPIPLRSAGSSKQMTGCLNPISEELAKTNKPMVIGSLHMPRMCGNHGEVKFDSSGDLLGFRSMIRVGTA